MYVDEHELMVRGGRGGDGKASFRREKYAPKGGPDGGDGGRGGNVVFVASHHLNGLGHLRFIREIKAPPGGQGGGSNCTGATADDTIVEVPVGTLVYEMVPAIDDAAPALAEVAAPEAEQPQEERAPTPEEAGIHAPRSAFGSGGASGEDDLTEPGLSGQGFEKPKMSPVLMVDLAEPGQRFIVAYGGRGGWGNRHFSTATNQRPSEFKPGAPGQERRLRLEVKLIADVGLVGLPNAGKSTLLSHCTKARPKIAPYPFTTLSPYLGVVQLGEREQFVMADIPGLIEGASQGKGLGHKFLRHVERTRVLIHLIDCSENEPEQLKADHDVIVGELAAFSPALAAKPRIVVANKSDIPGTQERAKELGKLLGKPVMLISGATGTGIKELLWAVWKEHAANQPAVAPPAQSPMDKVLNRPKEPEKIKPKSTKSRGRGRKSR
ncbi:MAG: GTPase ObgE [Planctomycetes bacterium]|nr:GTPase ObgE [Planctomycetota bacterium]